MSGATSISPPQSSTNIIVLKKAIYLLQQGCGYRPGHVPPSEDIFNETNIRAYRFKSSIYYRIYGFFICLTQLTLCFLEPNSLLLPSKQPSILSLRWCLLIELYCIIMHFIALYLSFRSVGCIRHQLRLYWYFCGICCVSILLTFIWSLSFFRIYRFLRVFFPFIYFASARIWKDMVSNAFSSVFKIMVFGILFSTTIFSILTFSLYNKRSLSHYTHLKEAVDNDELKEFNSLPQTMLHMFMYSVALNTPSLWSPIYKYNPIHCILWIVLLLIMYQLLQNILLSAICDQYNDIETEVVLTRVRKVKEKIVEAFQLVSDNNENGNFVSKNQMRYIYNAFNFEQYSFLYDPKCFDIYWLYCNDDHDQNMNIEQEEFLNFCLIWFSTIHLEYRHKVNDRIKNFFQRKVITKLSFADCILSIYSVIQSTLLLYRYYSSNNTEWIVVFLDLSNIFWIFEVVLRVHVLGIRRYIASRHLFNGIITFIIVSIRITSSPMWNFKYLAIDDDLHILRVGFVVICLADIDRKFHGVLYSTAYALRAITVFLVVVALFQIGLSLIGSELFANISNYIASHKDEDGTNAKWSSLADDEKSFNFDTFLNAFNLINIIFNENTFSNFMFYYLDETEFATLSYLKSIGKYIVIIYFLFAYIIQCMFLCNLLTSIFLTNYEFYVEHWIESRKLKQIRNTVVNKLQISADSVYPNTYIVSYWFPFLHSTHIDDVDQFLEIR